MAREIYFEHVIVGRTARVSAIDPETMTEVTVVGPAGASPRDLEQLALRKLEARLGASPAAAEKPAPSPSRSGGRLV